MSIIVLIVFILLFIAARLLSNGCCICRPLALVPPDIEQLFSNRVFLAVATPMLRDVATLMLETGMRPEEVHRIQPENVNLAGGFLFIPFGKTKAARRRVPLTTAARRVLARCMNGLETPYLFPCDTDATRPVPKVNNAHDRAVRD